MLYLFKILATTASAVLIVYSTEKLFKFALKQFVTKSAKPNYLLLFIIQITKTTYFLVIISLVFNYFPVDNKVFLLSILISLTINFFKNLLKLISCKQPI